MSASSSPSSQPNARDVARALIGGLALLLIVGGQFALRATAEGLVIGLVLITVALGLFIWAGARQPPAWLTRLVTRASLSYAHLLIGLAIALTLVTALAMVAYQRFAQTNYMPVLLLWIGAAAAYLSAFLIGRPISPGLRAWWQTYRWEALAVGAITGLAAGLRFYALGAIPWVINGDEGRLGLAALATRELPLANPFALFENFGALYLQGIQLAINFFGQSAFALRLLPAIGGTLAVPALYLLARWLFGPRVAVTAAALLASAHAHIHFSRTVAVGYIQGTLFIPLELYFFISGLQKRSALRLALSGLILGVHLNIYLSAQVVTALLAAYLVIAAIICRPLIQAAARQLPALWLGFVITGLPYGVQAWLTPEQFFARLNADGTFQSGWLQLTMAETGQGAVEILAGRAAHAFLTLNFYPAVEFYGARTSLLDFGTSVLFLVGLGVALWRTREPGFLLLNGYFWSVVLAVGIFSIPPSADSYRMLFALPAAVLLAALGVEQVLNVLSATGLERATHRQIIVGGLLAGILLLNLRTYFFDFAGQCRYGTDPQTRFASYLGQHLRAYNRETTVYLLSDDIFRYGTHGSVEFLSHKLPVSNWDQSMEALQPVPGSVIVANPNRADELKAWAEAHPGGESSLAFDCQALMLRAYKLP